VRHLTSAEEHKRRTLEGAFNPTRQSLYDDDELLEVNPFFGEFADVLDGSVARPSSITGEQYARVSSAFYNAVHATLSGAGSAEDNLAGLERTIDRLSRGGRW
jgi:trehalose/maltose transport system substrate-binding protein